MLFMLEIKNIALEVS